MYLVQPAAVLVTIGFSILLYNAMEEAKASEELERNRVLQASTYTFTTPEDSINLTLATQGHLGTLDLGDGTLITVDKWENLKISHTFKTDAPSHTVTFAGIDVSAMETAEPSIKPLPEITYTLTTEKTGVTVRITTGEEPIWIDWGDGQKEQAPTNAKNVAIRHNFQGVGGEKRITVTGKDFELHDGKFRKMEVFKPQANQAKGDCDDHDPDGC